MVALGLGLMWTKCPLVWSPPQGDLSTYGWYALPDRPTLEYRQAHVDDLDL